VFLRGFFGGAAAPHVAEWDDGRVVEAARCRFSRLLGPLPQPAVALVRRWPRSLPQYGVGHPQRMQALDVFMRELPGLSLIGNAYHGVGIPVLVHQARQAALAALAL
jgi:oxygen-dependent protoporphyrinogen oxidase